MRQKKLQDLTIKDNFMFGAVMTDPENCRLFLERALGFPISRVTVSKEKSIVYHPEYKGIRLDVYAQDDHNTHYNVEMQMLKHPALGKRSRYYHSQIDMELLLSGMDYEELPDTYVIFICNFDPFHKKKYCYTFDSVCREDGAISSEEGRHTIFLSTCGENEEDISEPLLKFLKFVKANLKESTEDFGDDYIQRLQDTIWQIKSEREMEERYMILEQMLKDERREGRNEVRRQGLSEGEKRGIAKSLLSLLEVKFDTIPEELREKINSMQDFDTLNSWVKIAAKAGTMEEFQEKISTF